MPWDSIGTFFISTSDWQFTSTGGLPVDESGDLAVRVNWGGLNLTKPIGASLLLADVYYIGPVPHVVTVRKVFFQRGVTSLVVFKVPGTYQDSGENFSAPGVFLWTETSNGFTLDPNIKRELGLRRTIRKKGFKKGKFPSYPWEYASDNTEFNVQLEIFTS